MAILSFRWSFIFVKTRKTAGTSIEVHLAQDCGPDDIVTPIIPANRQHHPRNHEGYFNHMPAKAIRDRQAAFFGEAFKFAFERHPVDKCLSHFAMQKHSPIHQAPDNPRTWSEYLDRGKFPVDTGLYTDEAGQLMVDSLFRYEELPEALDAICARTGLPRRPMTASEKRGFRQDDIPSLEAVLADVVARNIIMDAFASSLRHLAY